MRKKSECHIGADPSSIADDVGAPSRKQCSDEVECRKLKLAICISHEIICHLTSFLSGSDVK